MEENTWRIIQIGMWMLGLQTTIIITVMGTMWASVNNKFEKQNQKFEDRFDKIDRKIEKIENTLNDIDKRVFAIETMLHMKDCCILKSDYQIKKVE